MESKTKLKIQETHQWLPEGEGFGGQGVWG